MALFSPLGWQPAVTSTSASVRVAEAAFSPGTMPSAGRADYLRRKSPPSQMPC
jgi:hypothetical protein